MNPLSSLVLSAPRPLVVRALPCRRCSVAELARRVERQSYIASLGHRCKLGRRFASSVKDDGGPLPAHLTYEPTKISDAPTLLLVAQSAADSGHTEPMFWRSCSQKAQQLLGTVQLQDLVRFIEASARARYCDSELMYNFGDAAMETTDLDADSVGAALRAHALHGFRNDRVLRKLQSCLLELMQESRATASGLSSSLNQLAKLHGAGLMDPPPAELIAASGRMVTEHVSFFSVSHLCDVLEAFGIYRIQGNQQVSAMLAGIGGALAKDRNLTAVQCACALQAFAKCRVQDERLFVAIAQRLRVQEVRSELDPPGLVRALYGFAKFTCQDTALLDLLSIEVRRQLHIMDITSVSSTLSSIAKASVSSPVLMSRAAVQLKRSTPEEFDAVQTMDLTSLAQAFGKLQARDAKLFGDVLGEAFLRRAEPMFTTEPTEILVNIIKAFTRVHMFHPKLFGGISQALLERFPEVSRKDLVKYLHSVAKVEYQMPTGLRDKISSSFDGDSAAALGVFDLLKLAGASKRLGLEIPAVEKHVRDVLPYEPRGGSDGMGPGRRPTLPKRRRPSARKRKWTW